MKLQWYGWKLYIGDGAIVPTGYGAAWCDWSTRRWVCMPIPVNVIASRVRAIYFWFVHGYRFAEIDRRIQSAVNAERALWAQRENYEDAARRRRDFRAGYEYMFAVMMSEIDRKPKPEMPEWAK